MAGLHHLNTVVSIEDIIQNYSTLNHRLGDQISQVQDICVNPSLTPSIAGSNHMISYGQSTSKAMGKTDGLETRRRCLIGCSVPAYITGVQ